MAGFFAEQYPAKNIFTLYVYLFNPKDGESEPQRAVLFWGVQGGTPCDSLRPGFLLEKAWIPAPDSGRGTTPQGLTCVPSQRYGVPITAGPPGLTWQGVTCAVPTVQRTDTNAPRGSRPGPLHRGTAARCGQWCSPPPPPRGGPAGSPGRCRTPGPGGTPKSPAGPRGCGGRRCETGRWTPAPPFPSPAG